MPRYELLLGSGVDIKSFQEHCASPKPTLNIGTFTSSAVSQCSMRAVIFLGFCHKSSRKALAPRAIGPLKLGSVGEGPSGCIGRILVSFW